MQYVGQTNQNVSKRIYNFDSQSYASNVALHFNSYPQFIADFSFLPIDPTTLFYHKNVNVWGV